eukprot:gnl/MRDRNA2_/MRDRNA2_275688_c0_seq1.p1 gnl/MRDRNA2_/MRDRNA2_275688_c0~~gnl/MRDRNA2_/MRDRNA2_275688_c0_seq1.p1  ORF type:complete len:127 (-),score=23.76 gnl/MRDRNA2_/MRDRNA2_275688_c0_seq1:98-478(-)
MTNEPSFMFYERVAYPHLDFFFEDPYADLLAASLDNGHFALLIKNHAIMMAGKDVPQAFYRSYMFEAAAKAQLLAMATGQKLRVTDANESAYHRSSCEDWPGGFDGSLEWPGLIRDLQRKGSDYAS